MTEEELAEAIYWEAEQYIPFDIQDVNLHYQVLETGLGRCGQSPYERLAVGDRRRRPHPRSGVRVLAG